MSDPTPTPRINPDTGALEIILIDPTTGAVIGIVAPGEEPAPGARPVRPGEAEDDALWDPLCGRPQE